MKKISNTQKFSFFIVSGILFLLLFLFLFFQRFQNNSFIKSPAVQNVIEDKIAVYIQETSQKESLIYETDSTVYNHFLISNQKEDFNKRLHIVNGKNSLKYAYLSIEQNNKTLLTQKLEFNQNECYIDLSSFAEGIYDISLTVKDEHGITCYVSTETSFLGAVNNRDINGQTLFMMTDINITSPERKKISILYPFIWKTNSFHFQSNYELHFQSDMEGCMIIENESSESIKTGTVFCNTPMWDYKISTVFGEFTEDRYYYINAKTVNNTVIDTSLLYINTKDKLDRLLQNECLILSDHITHILFEGDLIWDICKLTGFLLWK